MKRNEGIQNLGNTCYFNSSVQLLRRMKCIFVENITCRNGSCMRCKGYSLMREIIVNKELGSKVNELITQFARIFGSATNFNIFERNSPGIFLEKFFNWIFGCESLFTALKGNFVGKYHLDERGEKICEIVPVIGLVYSNLISRDMSMRQMMGGEVFCERFPKYLIFWVSKCDLEEIKKKKLTLTNHFHLVKTSEVYQVVALVSGSTFHIYSHRLMEDDQKWFEFNDSQSRFVNGGYNEVVDVFFKNSQYLVLLEKTGQSIPFFTNNNEQIIQEIPRDEPVEYVSVGKEIPQPGPRVFIMSSSGCSCLKYVICGRNSCLVNLENIGETSFVRCQKCNFVTRCCEDGTCQSCLEWLKSGGGDDGELQNQRSRIIGIDEMEEEEEDDDEDDDDSCLVKRERKQGEFDEDTTRINKKLKLDNKVELE